MRTSLTLLAFAPGLWIGASAFAATVNVLQGQVLLNQGQGYRLIEGASEANPGDMIVVNPGGSAQIVYPDGCVVQIQPQSVVAIASQSPCQVQQQAQALPENDAPLVGGTTIAVGTIVLGGGIAAGILLSQKDKPASP